MTISAGYPSRLVVEDDETSHGGLAGYQGLHALVPVMIGLLMPIALLTLFDPRVLQNAQMVVHFVLFAILVVSGSIFVITLLNPGRTISVAFDAEARQIEFIRQGAFAHTVYRVPFNRVTAVRIETVYDQDGYMEPTPVIMLKPHERIELPAGIDNATLAEIRTLVGLR